MTDFGILPFLRGRIIWLWIAIFTFSLVLTSCSQSSNVDDATITGTVSLDGLSDYSGVKVEIYPLDTSLASEQDLTEAAGVLGVSLEQSRIFQHSNASPIATSQTNESGYFSMKVSKGIYNIVVSMDSYGYRYFTNVLVSDDISLNALSDTASITLHEEQEFSGVYTGSYIFTSESHTVITDNTSFVEGSQIIIEPGAVIRIAADRYLDFHGSVKLRGEPDSPIHFMADSSANSMVRENRQNPFDKIQILNTATIQEGVIDFVVFSGMQNGIRVLTNANINNCTFLGGQETLMINDFANANIQNCLFLNTASASTYSINIGLSNHLVFNNNVIWGSSMGMQAYATTDFAVENCFFDNDEIAVYLHNDVTAIFTHNTIKSLGIAIRSYISCTTEYYYNDVSSYVGFDFRGTYNYGIVNHNNLQCSYRAIEYISYSSGDMDAKQNYFYTTDPAVIATLVWDKTDYSVNHHLYDVLNYVVYSPFAQGPIASAGIR